MRKITNSLTLSSSNAGLLKEGVSESNAPFKQILWCQYCMQLHMDETIVN